MIFKISICLIKSLFVANLKIKRDFRFYLASVFLFKPSFRVNNKQKNSNYYYFKSYFLSLKHAFTVNNNIKTFQSKSNEAIFDGKQSFIDERKKFLFLYRETKEYNSISRDELLYFNSFIDRIIYILSITLIFPFGLLFLITTIEKGSLSLIFKELLEINNLILLLQQNGIKKLHHFCAYEVDSNIITYLLQNKTIIKTIKYPSEGPLETWYSIVITDTLVASSRYHFDEIEKFKNTMKYKELLFYGPHKIQNVYQIYSSKQKRPPKNTIGFISTASWLRKKMGHINLFIDLYENEIRVLSFIKSFLIKYPEVELKIFLHPKEKDENYIVQSLSYYNDLYSGLNFKIANTKGKSSAELFNSYDVAVLYSSTLAYERLFCGYKTLFVSNNQDFPIRGSSLRNLYCYSQEEFETKLKDSLKVDNDCFFNANFITNYIGINRNV